VGSGRSSKFDQGTVTASGPALNIYLMSESQRNSYLSLDSVISDNGHSVSLNISGNTPGDGGVFLRGDKSNTFTGNAYVSGRRNHLVLQKGNGAVAVRGDIHVKDQALLRFANSNQLLETSNVRLENRGALQNLANFDITNTFRSLTVADNGIVHFNHTEGHSENSKYYIKIDDLIINQSGHLEIHGWQESRDFLLVRKTSAALEDALTKMTFAGYDRNNIHLEEYDSEYWSISSTPEPATYGALLGAIGLGLWTWKRKRREMPQVPQVK